MVTILDCIERIPSVIENILERQEEAFGPFMNYVKEHIDEINEIVFIGSGTSNTSAVTSQPFVEKASGICTKIALPNNYAGEIFNLNPNALYVFTSQTGTSKVVCQVMEKLSAKGCHCLSMTEAPDTKLAKISHWHVCLNCGMEEHLMRTIGYVSSVLNHMLLGMKLGLAKGHITKEQYDAYLEDAKRVPDSHRVITEQTKTWFQKNKFQIIRSKCVIFTGTGSLYGVALEGAVKFWEMPQFISAGYELEEGMHGPNYGYDGNHCIVVLNDGGSESDKALSLARYMKEVFHNGLVAGTKVVDEQDLMLDIKGGDFACLEFSAVPQIIAYYLAVDSGRDISKLIDHTLMYSYFNTHS